MDSIFFRRSFIFFISSLLLSSCATTPEIPDIIQPDTTETTKGVNPSLESIKNAQQLEDNKQWQQAFSAWKTIADESKTEQKAAFINQAALMLFNLGQLDIIPKFYDDQSYLFSSIQTINNKNILLAASYFNHGKTYQSLTTLPELNTVTPNTFLVIALETKARAILNIGKPLDSVKIRLKFHALSTDNEQIDSNFKAIWDAIDRISENNIIKILQKPQDIELRGWLELSLIARRSNMLPNQMEPWMEQWHGVYTEHSASLFALQLLEQSKNIYINPTKIALILPLDGKLSKVSNAILNGFLYAHYQVINAEETINTIPEIEIVPIDSSLDFKSQYEQAILDGADFIVGPLNKNSVTELATSSFSNRVPTLALNYALEDNLSPNLFQYGLKPEDEAVQVADYALLHGHYNAATLMPDTDWGNRLNTAFKARYELFGGTIYSESKYPSKSNDYGVAIKNLLNLTQSKSRHSIIQTVIGEKTEFQPRRRKDIDMIFIGANARQARIIKPQLKFHYAQDIQVYATSHIANSNAKKSADRDRDLNGVYYVDMPWALKSNALQETYDIQKHWPTLNKSHGRLFALGIDAYRLIPQLKRLLINPEESYQGLTGKLSVDDKGRIRRELLLATYNKGQQVVITPEIE